MASNKNMRIYSTTTNAEGIFSFPDLSMANASDFTVKATDSDGKRELKVNLFKDLPGQMTVYIADNIQKYALQKTDSPVRKEYLAANPDLFVKAPKKIKTTGSNYDSQRKQLSSATSIMDVIKTIKPFKLVKQPNCFFSAQRIL